MKKKGQRENKVFLTLIHAPFFFSFLIIRNFLRFGAPKLVIERLNFVVLAKEERRIETRWQALSRNGYPKSWI